MSQLTNNYVFKVGMDFRSLIEFKDAISEWSVLNETEIKFVKNYKERCMIVFKKEYDFLAHCSKVVAYNHTVKLKTWYWDHKCPRVLDNGSSNSKFVSKYALDKIRTSEMKVINLNYDRS